ncbi:MAG: beta-lactamase family protein [Anaerolineaceae bacterium]|nr:beta-lactamase family protein [Anaerolineaceae bacterium]
MKRKEPILSAINKLETLLTGMLEKSGIPGCVLKIVFEDGNTSTLTWGTKERGRKEIPDANTIFMIGSCSKAFTAVTAALLSDSGQVNLDAPVSDLLPLSLERKGKKATLRHLLTNSSGLPNLGLSEIITGKVLYGSIPGDYAESYPFGNDESFLSFMHDAGSEMVGVPGEQYIYSNEGFSLASKALAVAGGKPFPDLVHELIFQPLGMRSSGYRDSDLSSNRDFAIGHLNDGSPAPVYFEPSIAGAGGVLSTANDMGHFVQSLLCQGNLEGKRVLPLSAIDDIELGRISHRTAASLVGSGFGSELYGMGMMVYPDFLGTKVFTHGGSTGNFSSSIFYNRDLGFGISALCNGAGGEGILALFAFMVTAQLLGRDPYTTFSIFSLEQELRSLEGVYSCRGNAVRVRINYRQGRLWWESIDQNKNSPTGVHPLTAENDPSCRRFRFLNGPGAASEVVFFAGEDGLMRVKKDRNVLTRGVENDS